MQWSNQGIDHKCNFKYLIPCNKNIRIILFSYFRRQMLATVPLLCNKNLFTKHSTMISPMNVSKTNESISHFIRYSSLWATQLYWEILRQFLGIVSQCISFREHFFLPPNKLSWFSFIFIANALSKDGAPICKFWEHLVALLQ